ncbi:Metabotropic glutamate receptor-like protein [Seminavis robusta]|uniref:Metabotropic glutamate receptor-like protein n=1 Tax=Seminavis robusta TaxID=568900 RepID=A0A9N8DYT1_9STRA|nr:Metabotropic glutamate receptor-like protein [Seminavis robusta]|eukprot:Sro385_g131650.1 Metabotropic glutamate receptor-like protein (1025) ;mRNA; r:21643-25212
MSDPNYNMHYQYYNRYYLYCILFVVASLTSGLGAQASATTTGRTGSSNLYEQGCLYSKNLTSQVRVCNSEDPLEALSLGLCRPPPTDYAEIRIRPADWHSSMMGSWIVQIILSELLNVPTSIEMGDPNLELNFYHPDSPFDVPVNNDTIYFKSFENAHNLEGDCTQAQSDQPCAHFDPETWDSLKHPTYDSYIERDILEAPTSLGMLATEAWYVPKFTAQRDPGLLNYLGLQGEAKRHILAERFRRPTTWKDYCRLVSANGCQTPDSVATRAPITGEEEDRMFAPGFYTGHFRATDKNNCTANPTTCTGHIADYPCRWSSPVETQIYHLNISLSTDVFDSGGYTPEQLEEIWNAANATKSDVIMYWWSPHYLQGEFKGTDAEFTPVTMPNPSAECLAARPRQEDDCDANLATRRGDNPLGACGDPPEILQKTISTTVHDTARSRELPKAVHSPSYDVLKEYELSELQINEIFNKLQDFPDHRQAVCEWASENMDYMQELVPRTYPRTFSVTNDMGALMYSTVTLGILVVMLVLWTLFMVYQHQDRRLIKYAQIEFLVLVLVGCLFIGLGAIVVGVPTSDFTCILEIWLINLGFTLELVPLIVKVSAVNRVLSLGQKMRRARINRNFLYGLVLLVTLLVVLFLTLWTVLDPPLAVTEYQRTDQKNEHGETIVWVVDVCGSNSTVWSYFSVGWNAFLLLWTSILALQMRNIKAKGFNETSTLALLVYTNLGFVLVRMFTYILASELRESILAYVRSFVFSIDTLMTVVIYFVPKFVGEDVAMSVTSSSGVSLPPSHMHLQHMPAVRNIAAYAPTQEALPAKKPTSAPAPGEPSAEPLSKTNRDTETPSREDEGDGLVMTNDENNGAPKRISRKVSRRGTIAQAGKMVSQRVSTIINTATDQISQSWLVLDDEGASDNDVSDSEQEDVERALSTRSRSSNHERFQFLLQNVEQLEEENRIQADELLTLKNQLAFYKAHGRDVDDASFAGEPSVRPIPEEDESAEDGESADFLAPLVPITTLGRFVTR